MVKYNAFFLKLGTEQGCRLSPFSFSTVLEVLTSTKKAKTEIKDIKTEKEEIKLTLFADDMICPINILRNLKFTLY